MPHPQSIRFGLLVPAFLCTAAFTAHATPVPFANGEFVTYSQDDWGGTPSPGNAAELLFTVFDSYYTGGLEVGIPGSAGFSAIFTSATTLTNLLPGTGTPGPLTADLVDPTSTPSGVFGGFVLALQLNVDLNDASLLTGTSDTLFGDLLLCNLEVTPDYNGLTVRELLAEMNRQLGSNIDVYTIDDTAALTEELTRAFAGGTPSQFAQDHLCLAQAEVVPEPATAGLVLLGLLGLGARRASRSSW